MHKIPHGETRSLNVTQESRWRIFVGLGWDPNDKVTLLDKAKALTLGHDIHHDLDLSCYIYDEKQRYISHVSAEAGRHVDQTGQIYHSGDNVEGVGDGDDEQISVELKDLDPAIHSLLFKASIKSGHSFCEVNAPEIRIADGYSGHNFLHSALNGEGSNEKSACIFVCVFRDKESGEWSIKHIQDYIDINSNEEWPERLKEYLPER